MTKNAPASTFTTNHDGQNRIQPVLADTHVKTRVQPGGSRKVTVAGWMKCEWRVTRGDCERFAPSCLMPSLTALGYEGACTQLSSQQLIGPSGEFSTLALICEVPDRTVHSLCP